MSLRDPLSVRPIRFTDDVPAWRTVLKALGAVLLSEDDGWLVYQLGAGRLALHTAAGSSETPGTTRTITFCRPPEPTWAASRAISEGLSAEVSCLSGRARRRAPAPPRR